jgi:hypothetical protein
MRYGHDPHYSADWAKAAEQDAIKRAEIAAARAEEERKHEAAEREKYFASLRR